MSSRRCSPTGGVFGVSTIGRLPRREMRFDQWQMMFVEPVGNLARSGEPDAGMRQDVFHRAAEHADAVRLADPVGMQRYAHHAALFGAFLVHRIEVVADLARKVVRFLTTAV